MRRRGFTLIELLIVVVILGLLAAFAVPRFAYTKEKAFFATMKSDLRNLAAAQESFAADNQGAYAAGTATGPTAIQGLGHSPSSGVTLEVTATPGGWSAVASMTATPRRCGMFINHNDPPAAPGGRNPATTSGQPMCN